MTWALKPGAWNLNPWAEKNTKNNQTKSRKTATSHPWIYNWTQMQPVEMNTLLCASLIAYSAFLYSSFRNPSKRSQHKPTPERKKRKVEVQKRKLDRGLHSDLLFLQGGFGTWKMAHKQPPLLLSFSSMFFVQTEMDAMAATHPDQFKVYYVLNQVWAIFVAISKWRN